MAHVLAFFAHPDDETLSAGAQIAHLAQRHEVHLISATRGELGESVPGVIRDFTPAKFVARRELEYRRAAAALGAVSYTFLDRFGAGSVTDSGMVWADDTHTKAEPDPQADPNSAFSLGDLEQQAQALARAIDYYRPQLLLTEEPGGGYGHPDHVRCHQVAARAVELSQHPVKFVAYSVLEEAALRADLAALAGSHPRVLASDGPLPSQVIPGADMAVSFSTNPYRRRLLAAHHAHATQITGIGQKGELAWYELTDGVRRAVPPVVGFVLEPGRVALNGGAELAGAAELNRAGELNGAGELNDVTAESSDMTAEFIDFVAEGRRPGPSWYPIAISIMVAVIGLFIGAIGTVSHRSVLGLVLAFVAVIAGGVLARSMAGVRGAFGYWLANGAAIMAMTYIRPGGDVLVTTDALSTIWLFGGIIVGLSGLAVPRRFLKS